MNSTTFLNKVEIRLYSILISVLSGINHLKAPMEHTPPPLTHETVGTLDPETGIDDTQTQKTSRICWDAIQQTLLSLLLWTILGFAAGFLIGMIKPG